MSPSSSDFSEEAIMPGDVPVSMPVLPARLTISTAQQFKAMGDPTRLDILALIQSQPATAKQIAARLKAAPGTIGHHLQILEEAGLVQIVARRLIHGIVAKYYTRTARVFYYNFPRELDNAASSCLRMLTDAYNQLAESVAAYPDEAEWTIGFPRARLSPERAQSYRERLKALTDDFAHEIPDSQGEVYSLSIAYFKAPPHLQPIEESEPPPSTDETEA